MDPEYLETTCANCGKLIIVDLNDLNIFCSDECQIEFSEGQQEEN